MIGKLRAMAIGLAIAAGLAGPAAAQSAEAVALGTRAAHSIITAMKLDQVMADAAASSMTQFNLVKSRPEWSGLLVQSLRDEILNDMPAVEAILGRAFARNLTLGELRAGVTLLEDPAIQAMMASGAKGGAKPTAEPGPAAAAAAVSPAGIAFFKRLENLDKIMDPLEDEIMIELLPGTFRRFGDKAEAMKPRGGARVR